MDDPVGTRPVWGPKQPLTPFRKSLWSFQPNSVEENSSCGPEGSGWPVLCLLSSCRDPPHATDQLFRPSSFFPICFGCLWSSFPRWSHVPLLWCLRLQLKRPFLRATSWSNILGSFFSVTHYSFSAARIFSLENLQRNSHYFVYVLITDHNLT